MWLTWHPIFKWKNLCPVIYADPIGLLVVMPRAVQPVTQRDVDESTEHDYPDITAETKPEDFGRLGSHVVALDYGLPDADLVHKNRVYFAEVLDRQKAAQ